VFFGRPPSELFDLLASVLGLEDLAAADKRLQAAAKLRDNELSAAKKDLELLRPRLTVLATQDERADACVKALAGTNPARWDIDDAAPSPREAGTSPAARVRSPGSAASRTSPGRRPLRSMKR
jgi:hypothetical protein